MSESNRPPAYGRYRKKPVEIEARQLPASEQNLDEVRDLAAWCGGHVFAHGGTSKTVSIIIPTLEGDVQASPGDWVIHGVKGEHYPCKPDIFDATYEAVEEARAMPADPIANSPTANTRDCFTDFIGQRVLGVLFDAIPLHRRDVRKGTKTIVFEDGRGLTITSRGSFWVTTADEINRAVQRKARDLKATSDEIEAVLKLAGAL